MGNSKNRGAEELQDYSLLSLYDSTIERVPYQVTPLFLLIFKYGAIIVTLSVLFCIFCFLFFCFLLFVFFFLLMLFYSLRLLFLLKMLGNASRSMQP